METKILIMAALLLTTTAAWARLGDTCELNYLHYGPVLKRYNDTNSTGTPSTNDWHAAYATTNYLIAVYYRDNISVCEIFYPATGKFAPEERELLMNKIGAGGPGSSRWAVWTATINLARAPGPMPAPSPYLTMNPPARNS